MLKKAMASIITFIIIFTLAGCNDTNIELLSKLNQASKWEAVKNEQNIELVMSYEGQVVTVELEIETYTKNKGLQLEGSASLKSVALNEEKIDFTTGEYKISPIKFYMDGFKVCMSTAEIKEACTKMGVPVPAELEPAYIGMDMTEEMNSQLTLEGMTMDDFMAQNEEIIEEIAKLNVDLPTEKSGDTYTIQLNESSIVDLIMDLVVEVYKMEGGVVDQLQFTEEQKAQIIADLEKEKSGETVALLKQMLKGSLVDVKYTITDDTVDSTMKLALKVNTGVEEVEIIINADSKSNKAEVKDIVFPNEAKLYTVEELANVALVAQESQSTVAEEKQVIIVNTKDIKVINGVSYAPAKPVFNQMGIALVYNPETKQVLAKVSGQEMPIDVKIVNGVSYVDVTSFEATYGIELKVAQ